MNTLSAEQSARRERTMLVAIILSAFGPFATGYAVAISQSTTQIADFVRRTVELIAMIVSWAVFRRLARGRHCQADDRRWLERAADTTVGVAMALSAIVIAVLAVSRLGTYVPGGRVYPGLTIAILGFAVNTWFWRRYAAMTRETYDPIILTQSRLYVGKAAVDLCVVAALAAVAAAPGHAATRAIDVGGSVVVSLYLAWSGLRIIRSTKNRKADRERKITT